MSNVISMESIKERLRHLSDYMPELKHIHSDIINYFGNYFAKKLSDKHNPEGFYLALELAISNLENGFDATTGEKLIHQCQPAVYELLREIIPDITDAVNKEYKDFSEKVKLCSEQVFERYVEN